MKALGVGLGAVDLLDIAVTRGVSGVPSLALGGRAAAIAASRGVAMWHLSLSHSETTAMAVVLALGDDA